MVLMYPFQCIIHAVLPPPPPHLPPAKRNITDEKKALEDALDKYESEGLQSGSLRSLLFFLILLRRLPSKPLS